MDPYKVFLIVTIKTKMTGVEFSVFFGEDGDASQEIYHFTVKTVTGKVAKSTGGTIYDDTWLTDPSMPEGSSSTLVNFTGFSGVESSKLYEVPYSLDPYGGFNYITFLADSTVDISKLKPQFSKEDSTKVYVNGALQTSGEQEYDFSKGAIQYTAASENGNRQENYWLQVKRGESGAGKLYINSFADEAAKTTEQNGVIRSIRELIFDGYHKMTQQAFLRRIRKPQ